MHRLSSLHWHKNTMTNLKQRQCLCIRNPLKNGVDIRCYLAFTIIAGTNQGTFLIVAKSINGLWYSFSWFYSLALITVWFAGKPIIQTQVRQHNNFISSLLVLVFAGNHAQQGKYFDEQTPLFCHSLIATHLSCPVACSQNTAVRFLRWVCKSSNLYFVYYNSHSHGTWKILKSTIHYSL